MKMAGIKKRHLYKLKIKLHVSHNISKFRVKWSRGRLRPAGRRFKSWSGIFKKVLLLLLLVVVVVVVVVVAVVVVGM
jgi:hypothetical protein